MRIVNILFKVHFFRLKYSTAAAGIIVLFFCSPLWGYVPDLHQPPSPVLFSDHYMSPLTEYLCKRGSRNQNFQQWQDLSPQEQEKLRKKYREWQSLSPEEQQIIRRRMNQLNRMPSQKRKLYKQLFRQWQDLPPKERKQLQDDLDNWEYLSPRQRDSIRRRFNN
jgi:mRNA-degrading endonuclease RelE of RelBE toxin-antitoxin system